MAIILFLFFLNIGMSYGQIMLDFSAGTSSQDNYVSQLAIRYQFTENFRAGLEFQNGFINERFIAAKPIEEGFATSISIPFIFRLSNLRKIQLYNVNKVGIRFQGVIDPDDNDRRDSTLTSTAFIADFGLVANVNVSEKFHIQCGSSAGIGLENSPEAIFEYIWTNIHAGVSYQMNSKSVLFFKSNFGPAFGAGGDTYKFISGVQAGIRLNLGRSKSATAHFMETSL